MDQNRRTVLRGSVAVSALALASGLLRPAVAALPEKAYEATTLADALKAAFGTDSIPESAEVSVKAPPIAENSAVVPVTVETTLKGVEEISIIIEKNPRPLTASFAIPNGTDPFAMVRVKMRETSNVTAVVKANGKYFRASQEVKVTIGGCGG